jgi:hypothetical protein
MQLNTLRHVHFLQNWSALSETMAKESLYDSEALRRRAWIDLGGPNRFQTAHHLRRFDTRRLHPSWVGKQVGLQVDQPSAVLPERDRAGARAPVSTLTMLPISLVQQAIGPV